MSVKKTKKTKKKTYEKCSFCIKNGYFGCISCSKKPIHNDYDGRYWNETKKFEIIKMKKITKLKNSYFHQYMYLIKDKYFNRYRLIYDVHIVYSKCNLCKYCYTDIKKHYSSSSHKKYTNLHDIKKSYYVNSIINLNTSDEFIAIHFFNSINKLSFKDLQGDVKKSLNTNCKTIKNAININFYRFDNRILKLFNKFKKVYDKEYPKKIKEANDLLHNILPKELCNYIMEWC